MGNFGGVRLGVHSQSFQILQVGDQDNLVTRWRHELGLLVGTVTDGWFRDVTSESSSDDRVDTLLLSPVLGDSVVSVRVMTLELLSVLLDNLWVR